MNNNQKILSLNLESFIHGRLPNDSTTVSRDANGEILSNFGDPVWDFSSSAAIYSSESEINFSLDSTNQNSTLLIQQIKLVLYYIIFSRKRRDNNITVKSINSHYYSIRKIANLCLKYNCDFSSLQTNHFFLNEIRRDLYDLKWETQKKYIRVIEFINKTGQLYDINNFGFPIKFVTELKKNLVKQDQSNKQTLLIPVSIYAKFIDSGLEFFEELTPIIENFFNFLNNEIFYKNKFEKTFLQPLNFKNLTEKYNLVEYFNKHNITNPQKLIFFIQATLHLGARLVLCFSGMRKSESMNLAYHSYQEIKRRNLPSAWILRGATSKYTQVGVINTTWVTSDVIANVIFSLQGIARIHKVWSAHNGQPTHLEIEDYPLFPSFASKHEKSFHPIFKMPLGAYSEDVNSIYRVLTPIIFTDEDLKELVEFNPLINWLEEYNLEIGKPWKFSTHQFRRSLTVYCARSGLVKIPTLKRQLKHLRYDTTLYYGNNYLNSKDMISESARITNSFDQTLINEFKEQTLAQQFAEFTKEVVENPNSLFGAEGTRIQNQKNQVDIPKYLSDRNATEKYIYEGRIAFRKTVHGYCSRANGCNKFGFSHVTACVSCSFAIFNEDSIDALELAKESFSKMAKENQCNGETLLYEQYMNEVISIDRLLDKHKRTQIEVKNV